MKGLHVMRERGRSRGMVRQALICGLKPELFVRFHHFVRGYDRWAREEYSRVLRGHTQIGREPWWVNERGLLVICFSAGLLAIHASHARVNLEGMGKGLEPTP